MNAKKTVSLCLYRKLILSHLHAITFACEVSTTSKQTESGNVNIITFKFILMMPQVKSRFEKDLNVKTVISMSR